MQIDPLDIQPATKVDLGELLLTTVQRSEIVIPALQGAVATYAQWLSQPVRYIQPIQHHKAMAVKLGGKG